MDDALRDLYQDMILGHNKSPKNKGTVADADARHDGYNPLCGDQVTVTIKFDGETISEIMFEGHGCAIDTASASMMTEAVKGKTKTDALAISNALTQLVMREDLQHRELLGKLEVFAGVGEFPARVKCATLPWRTLEAALQGVSDAVSTE